MKLADVKPNPDNPRVIRDEKFKRLCKSIQDFPVQWGLDVPVFNPECSDDKEKEKEPIICPHCGNKIPN